jgi:hypothetical protein
LEKKDNLENGGGNRMRKVFYSLLYFNKLIVFQLINPLKTKLV